MKPGSYVAAMRSFVNVPPDPEPAAPPVPTARERAFRKSLLVLIKETPTALQSSCPPEFRNDRKFCLDAVRANPASFLYAPLEFTNDRSFLLECIKLSNGRVLKITSEGERENIHLVKEAFELSDGHALKFAGTKLQANEDVVLQAVALGDGKAIRYAHADLRNDRNFVLRALRVNPNALRYLEPQFDKDNEMQFSALRRAHGNEEKWRQAKEKENRAQRIMLAKGLPTALTEEEALSSSAKDGEDNPFEHVHVGMFPEKMWPPERTRRNQKKKDSRYSDPREEEWWRKKAAADEGDARIKQALKAKADLKNKPKRRATIKG